MENLFVELTNFLSLKRSFVNMVLADGALLKARTSGNEKKPAESKIGSGWLCS